MVKVFMLLFSFGCVMFDKVKQKFLKVTTE